jgi:Kef-type K+ transport system membrane component KefB
VGVAHLLFQTYNSKIVAFAPFCLFVALVMSITGFPSLNRLLAEKKLLGTKLGSTSLDVAKFDDIILFLCLLFVLPFIQNTGDYGNYNVFLPFV